MYHPWRELKICNNMLSKQYTIVSAYHPIYRIWQFIQKELFFSLVPLASTMKNWKHTSSKRNIFETKHIKWQKMEKKIKNNPPIWTKFDPIYTYSYHHNLLLGTSSLLGYVHQHGQQIYSNKFWTKEKNSTCYHPTIN